MITHDDNPLSGSTSDACQNASSKYDYFTHNGPHDGSNNAFGRSTPLHSHFVAASPLDRLASNIIDVLMVLGPFLMVLVAPFKKIIQKAILFENPYHLVWSSTLCVGIIVLLGFVYKTYLTWHYGGTLGQLFMSLRVVDIWEPQKRKLGQCALRSTYWIASCFLLGIPFLSMMSNDRRRCFHDRVSDTVVLSLNGKVCPRPSVIEKIFIRSTFSAILILLVFIASLQFYLFTFGPNKGNSLAYFFDEEDRLCATVNREISHWPEEKHSRLSLAMALYAAGEVDESCLKKEVDKVYKVSGHPGSGRGMMDLASAFIYADDRRLSDKYFRMVCHDDPQSESCLMTRIMGSGIHGINRHHINKHHRRVSGDMDSLFKDLQVVSRIYVKIWGGRYFYRHGEYEKSMKIFKSIIHVIPLDNFLSMQMARLQWMNLRGNESHTKDNKNNKLESP